MATSADELLELAEQARLTWDPVEAGKRAWICFDDDNRYDLGPDASGNRFLEIARRMMNGHYYPEDAIRMRGRYLEQGRGLRPGDRILQEAPLFGKLGGPVLRSAVEMYVAELTSDMCRIGYVTTAFHYGRGVWSAELQRKDHHLWLTVKSVASPKSWLFWLGLPLARWLQVRARRRAVQEFIATTASESER